MRRKFNLDKILNRALIASLVIIAIIIGMFFLTSCSTKDKKHLIQGYETITDSVQAIEVITDGLCASGVIKPDDCIKLAALYTAVDILKPILDELSNEIFTTKEGEKQQSKIAEYILKLSEFNTTYTEIMKIFLKYN